jgi:hypothetical protein
MAAPPALNVHCYAGRKCKAHAIKYKLINIKQIISNEEAVEVCRFDRVASDIFVILALEETMDIPAEKTDSPYIIHRVDRTSGLSYREPETRNRRPLGI